MGLKGYSTGTFLLFRWNSTFSSPSTTLNLFRLFKNALKRHLRSISISYKNLQHGLYAQILHDGVSPYILYIPHIALIALDVIF